MAAPLVLEAPQTPNSGGRLLVYAVAVSLVVGGIWLAVARATALPLVASCLGVYAYVWLFRSEQTVSYQAYLTVNEHGIEYVHSHRPRRRVARYAWGEIVSVKPLLESQGEDVQGLQIITNRHATAGVPVLLPIATESECRAAHVSALEWLHSPPNRSDA